MADYDGNPDGRVVDFTRRKSLESGGGGGHDGGMEARVARLEKDVTEIKGILGRIELVLKSIDDRQRKFELDVAEIKGRLQALPTTAQLLALVMAVFGASFGLLKYFQP